MKMGGEISVPYEEKNGHKNVVTNITKIQKVV